MLLHPVNDILDYARLEAGQLKLEQRALDPQEVAGEALVHPRAPPPARRAGSRGPVWR